MSIEETHFIGEDSRMSCQFEVRSGHSYTDEQACRMKADVITALLDFE